MTIPVPTQSDSPVTLTTIQFTGGEVAFTEADLRASHKLHNTLVGVLKISIFYLAQILCEIHQKKYFLISNENLTGNNRGQMQTPDTEKVAFEKWARRMGLGHRYSYLMRLIKIADLYDDHSTLFETLDEVPSREKLIFLAQHRGHAKVPELIEAATGTPENWRAAKAEIIGGKDPDEAHEEAAKEVRRIHKKILEREHRTPIDRRPKWRSQDFRRWVRHQPCIFTGTRDHRQVDPAHIHSTGAGYDDYRNVLPLRNDLHRRSHDHGWSSLLEAYDKDREWLHEQADCVLVKWLSEVFGPDAAGGPGFSGKLNNERVRIMKSEQTKLTVREEATGNLAVLISALAEVCMCFHLFGAETQAVIDLCDDMVIPDNAIATADQLNVLRQRLKRAVTAPAYGQENKSVVIEAFQRAIEREYGILRANG
jgi:hypothetical protein